MLASQGDYLEALDCLTIIENMAGPFEESHLLVSTTLTKRIHRGKGTTNGSKSPNYE